MAALTISLISVAGAVNLVIAKPAINANALPTGVGGSKTFGTALKRSGLGSTFDKPNPFRDIDDEPPAKVREVFRFRWGWGE